MSPSDGLATSTQEDEWLWGWDPMPGIVSVWADSDGAAIVWRRIGATGELIRAEARFRPWLLLDRLDDLYCLGSGLCRARCVWAFSLLFLGQRARSLANATHLMIGVTPPPIRPLLPTAR